MSDDGESNEEWCERGQTDKAWCDHCAHQREQKLGALVAAVRALKVARDKMGTSRDGATVEKATRDELAAWYTVEAKLAALDSNDDEEEAA